MRSRLFYHLVWTTRDRNPVLDAAAVRFLGRYLRSVARQERARILALGVVRTHVHVLLEASSTTLLPRLVQRFKGGSSALINREGHTEGPTPVRWAKGYAIHTVSARGLRAARAYVEGQDRHHPKEAIELAPGARGGECRPSAGVDPAEAGPRPLSVAKATDPTPV
jgi:putative transposase